MSIILFEPKGEGKSPPEAQGNNIKGFVEGLSCEHGLTRDGQAIETAADVISLMGMCDGDEVFHSLREYESPQMAFQAMKRVQYGRGLPGGWKARNKQEAPTWLTDFCDDVR